MPGMLGEALEGGVSPHKLLGTLVPRRDLKSKKLQPYLQPTAGVELQPIITWIVDIVVHLKRTQISRIVNPKPCEHSPLYTPGLTVLVRCLSISIASSVRWPGRGGGAWMPAGRRRERILKRPGPPQTPAAPQRQAQPLLGVYRGPQLGSSGLKRVRTLPRDNKLSARLDARPQGHWLRGVVHRLTAEPEPAGPAAAPQRRDESSDNSSSDVGIARGSARQRELRLGRRRRRRHLTVETAEGSSLLEQMALSAPSPGGLTLVLGSGWLACVHPLWDSLAELAASRPVWNFVYPQYCRMFRMCLDKREVTTPIVPFQLRLSGVSIDVTRGGRQLDEAQKRGQWRATASVARYERHPRSAGASHTLRPGQRARFMVFEARLGATLHRRPNGAAVGLLDRG